MRVIPGAIASLVATVGWCGPLYDSAINAPDDVVQRDGVNWQRIDLPKGTLVRESVSGKEFFRPMLPEFERAEIEIDAYLPETSCVTGFALTVKTFPGTCSS
ncbi:MAG: hypothetical protein ACOX5G_00735 [Kiritimatiellia bacterium]|jgi:hypothetical protein